MIIPQSMPKIKRFFKGTCSRPVMFSYMVRLMAGFLDHRGRMSAGQAAGVVASQARHPAGVSRFLRRHADSVRWLRDLLTQRLLEAADPEKGIYVFVLDATDVTQQGVRAENTFSTGNRKRRNSQFARYNKRRVARHSCHRHVMGLLLTPSGVRIPSYLPYYTRDYCQAKKTSHRTQADLGADLIRSLKVPDGARVIVVGDTAFEAKQIRSACEERGFTWIMPANTERVLAGDKPRAKVWSLIGDLPGDRYVEVRLASQKAMFASQRRMASRRGRSKKRIPTYYVHQERRFVHSLGETQLVFSTKSKPQSDKSLPRDQVKILMTNDFSLSSQQVVALYALRWQIELFFKELKSYLGMHHYRFRQFQQVETWVNACLIAFIYLEWIRCQRLKKASSATDRKRWQRQRTYGLATAVRQHVIEAELIEIHRCTRTDYGQRKLRKILQTAIPADYQLSL
jgi:DDE family transposase